MRTPTTHNDNNKLKLEIIKHIRNKIYFKIKP